MKKSALVSICDYLRTRRFPVAPSVKNLFRTALFRTAWYSNDHEELERIFRCLEDPWNFERSPYEQERMKLLLREVERHQHASILEVGCAEGIFTGMLSAVTEDIVGIDVSPTAISRARRRCPGATFVTTSLESFVPGRSFDLVVCAETLYYIQDVRNAIRKLSALGRRCIASYIIRESGRLDGEIGRIPGIKARSYEIGSRFLRRGMIVATWENEASGARGELCHTQRQHEPICL